MVINDNSPKKQSKELSFALDMVEEFARTGIIAVSVEPTPAMLEAGAQAGEISEAAARKVYLAMLSAF
ncbi:MAG: hypothetical protein WCF85_01340 [Rhodospirillaceae bacterium]